MGGRGTAGGIVFQAEVGAFAAGLLLTERPIARLGGNLPGTPKKVLFETPDPVDDVLIQTDCGSLYVQAKRTISLSASADGELASVIDQFVRQYRTGVEAGSSRRDLDPSKDRLVLAVSDATFGPVKNNLREVLDRNRTGSATGLPQALSDALKVFGDLISSSWLKEAGAPLSPTEKQKLLSVCSVVVLGDAQHQIVEEALRDIAAPGEEGALLDLLKNWAAQACKDGVGGDEATIRCALSSKTRLKAAPSFQPDIDRLINYSKNIVSRLSRFTRFNTPDGDISITRTVTEVVVAAARASSLAITGEPGAGKSGVIHDSAEILSKEAPVFVLSVEAGSTSLDALRREIGLDHSLIDVLRYLSHSEPAYLFLDALDAVRGGAADGTYKRLVEEVSVLPGWRVVASVRSFDLRLGRDWRRLFAGTPPDAAHSDESFKAVRHLHVGLLNAEELTRLNSISPTLAAAIAVAGGKMEALARNPFNLALLGDLLSTGTSASALATIATRGQLLEKYWDERISDLGIPATVGLREVVAKMIASKSIDIPETEVPMAASTIIQDIHRAGVLITETNRRVGFRHHILFDYATSRLILLPDRFAALLHLTKASGAGLLISPSLGYWLDSLKSTLSLHEYWSFVANILQNEDTDPIIRVECARLSVESVAQTEDMTALSDVLGNPETAKSKAFAHIVGSIATKAHFNQPIEVEAWARLAEGLKTPHQAQISAMRALVGILIDKDLSEDGKILLGSASRTLFDIMSADDNLISWLSPHVLPFLAKTYAENKLETRARLKSIFSPSRFSRFGHIEVPWLAREALAIAEADPDFSVQLHYHVFKGGDFSTDQITSMSKSWILSLTSNAKQDYAGAEHALSRSFPDLLRTNPKTAARALAATLRGQAEKEHCSQAQDPPRSIEFDGEIFAFREDASYSWAWDIDARSHDDYAKMYKAFFEWLPTVDDESLIKDIPYLMLRDSGTALVWRAVFELGSIHHTLIGQRLLPAALNATALGCVDTMQSAINLVSVIYSSLPGIERTSIEGELLGRDFSEFPDPAKARVKILATLFEAIGETELGTEDARIFLESAKGDGRSYANRKPFEVRSSWESEDAHWLMAEGVDVEAAGIAPLLSLASTVRSAVSALKEDESSERKNALWDAVVALRDAIATAGSIDPEVEQEICDALAEGFGLALAKDCVPENDRASAVQSLMQLAEHENPQLSEDTEENFARSPSWGSPSPRIEAAQSIAHLATMPTFWPIVRDTFESLLLNDPHPAVRLQVAQALGIIGRLDPVSVWPLFGRFVEKETNSSVVRHGTAAISCLAASYAETLEPHIHSLAAKFPPAEHGDDPITGLVTFFALHKELPKSITLLNDWTNNFCKNERQLHCALYDIQNNLVVGFASLDPGEARLRAHSREFLASVMAAAEPAARSWPLSDAPPTAEEECALKLFAEAADRVFYAAGHEALAAELQGKDAQRSFLNEYGYLISKLTTLGTPRAVHNLIDVIGRLVGADPERCFDLFSAAMLRTTGVSKYEYENMGATRFVELVGIYLSDFRYIFTDELRRQKLIDCIAIFVEAGWPEARSLFLRLPTMLQ